MKMLRFIAGPLLGAILFGLLTQSFALETPAAAVAMLSLWMALWWVTEAVPLELTALLPMLVLPLTGLYPENAMMKSCAPYAHESVYFFLGGFGLGLAIEKTTLHRRGALFLLRWAGSNAAIVVGTFMLSTALLSMWMNNTATTMLMLPLAMSVIATQEDRRFATSLLIGVAYAASIGGMGTLVGTAPNIFFAGFLEQNNIELGFLNWMAIALPIVATLLIGCWVWMVWILWPMGDLKVEAPSAWKEEWANNPGFTTKQTTTLIIFCIAACMWILRDPLLAYFDGTSVATWIKLINDPWIAMASMAALLIFPIGSPVLEWADIERIPWGVLLLFGGGMSLSIAISASGLDKHIAAIASQLHGVPTYILITCVVILVIAISELASNLATATTMIPILMSAAPAMGIDPLMLLSATVLASSCGFMMPVATPPNTLVFAQRRFPVRDMLLAGLGVNVLSAIAIPIFVLWILPWVVRR
ncbi:MAG: SLC13 family permease [Pirellula sp.]|jgi:sodium-dependent dicarboxylate transporter 2/3/5